MRRGLVRTEIAVHANLDPLLEGLGDGSGHNSPIRSSCYGRDPRTRDRDSFRIRRSGRQNHLAMAEVRANRPSPDTLLLPFRPSTCIILWIEVGSQ